MLTILSDTLLLLRTYLPVFGILAVVFAWWLLSKDENREEDLEEIGEETGEPSEVDTTHLRELVAGHWARNADSSFPDDADGVLWVEN